MNDSTHFLVSFFRGKIVSQFLEGGTTELSGTPNFGRTWGIIGTPRVCFSFQISCSVFKRQRFSGTWVKIKAKFLLFTSL